MRQIAICFGLMWLTLAVGCAQGPGNKTPLRRPDGPSLTRYAHNLTILRDGSGYWVEIRIPKGNITDTVTIRLVDRADSYKIGDLESVTLVPVRSVACLSTTHTAMLERLGLDSLIKAVPDADYLYSPKLRAGVASGSILPIAIGGSLNEEVLIAAQPELLLTSASNTTEADPYDAARQARIQVLPIAEWLENHPLGRAEWLLLYGALTGTMPRAQAAFDSIATAYEGLASKARNASPKPVVIGGQPFNDVWYMAGGRSYLAQFVQDAGGSYPWAQDTTAGSLPLSLETVIPQALQADYWLNPGQVPTQADIIGKDSRYDSFKPVKLHQLYGYYARVNGTGGNDYFESGVINPHLLLADMVRIFHPALLPGHTLVYYRHLP